MIVAAAVRGLALVHGAGVVSLWGDENYYTSQGASIASGLGYPGSFRPPLYPLLIGTVFAVFGHSLLVLRLVQIGVSLAAVALVHEICRERFGLRAALWSALACALSPPLAHFTHFLWAETLFVTLFLLFAWLLHRFESAGGTATLVGAAVTLGLAALTKEMVVFYAFLLVPWFAACAKWDWRRGLGRAGLFLGCFVLVLTPWIVRNWSVNDRFVGLSNCRWFPIAMGNLRAEDLAQDSTKRLEFQRRWQATTGELEREALSRTVALESIRSQQPWWLPRKLQLNMSRLFSPKSQELRLIERGLYPPEFGPAARRTHLLISLAGHLLLLTPGLMALWLVRGDGLKWPLVTMIGYSLFVYTVANATPRFLVALLPLFYLYVGPLITRVAIGTERWRWAAALGTAAIFVAIVLLQVPVELGPLWNELGSR